MEVTIVQSLEAVYLMCHLGGPDLFNYGQFV